MSGEVPVSPHVHHNIHSIDKLKRSADAKVGKHQRVIEGFTRWVSRPITVYILLALPALWVAVETIETTWGIKPIDPAPFPLLQGIVTLYAACAATAVLVAQTRQRREEEQRAQLELQVSLLAEQKATKIIALLEELRRDLPIVKNRTDREAEALGENIDPHAVLTALQTSPTPTPPPPPPR